MFEKEPRGSKQDPKLVNGEKMMKIENSDESNRVSKRRFMGKGVGALLKEGRGRFYILRRCIMLLLCSHD
ncbi:unnamed protein product [Lupinus luteus]|uniref:Uncharacterized protein n=1 Tax=Lupinus luteus TaxID=3873 RepID=A0AAV1YMK2_LUPLU